MKATTSLRRIRKSSPKCSAELTRYSRVSRRTYRNRGPRRKSAARIPAYPPERFLDRSFDRVVAREGNHATPQLRYMPAIIDFLGYNPLPSARIRAERLVRHRTSLG